MDKLIKDRPIEVLNWAICPDDDKEAYVYVRTNGLRVTDDFNMETERIPEFQELKKKTHSERVKQNTTVLYESFQVFTAVIDRDTHSILDLRYGIPKDCEMYSCDRDTKICELLLKEHSWLMKKFDDVDDPVSLT